MEKRENFYRLPLKRQYEIKESVLRLFKLIYLLDSQKQKEIRDIENSSLNFFVDWYYGLG